jgi:expansin (peptidoglycan-binding protein)
VSCNFGTPLAVQNKEGTSQYWFSMQVQNANWPVDTLDISTDGGQTWQPTVSRDYNFFESAKGGGFGTATVDLRISCFNNKKVYMKGVTVEDNKKVYATENC